MTDDADAPSNVTAETSLAFHVRYAEMDSDLGEALAGVKSVRRRIKALRREIEGAGIDLKGFDRARSDAALSGSEREAMIAEHRRQLAWLKKPIGMQATLDLPAAEFTPAELDLKKHAGYAAGRAGHRRDSNPENLNTEAFVAWDGGWMDGQKELAEELGEAPESRKRGRKPNVAGAGRA
ncbi:MAG TPA: hypothetical protein VNF04_04300 [Stellaceae bacterium]|nr:hypothetical protein [Stellaceae bacterium]